MNRTILFVSLFVVVLLASCESNKEVLSPDAAFEKELTEKFAAAQSGDIIELPEGTFLLKHNIPLKDKHNIIIRGKGREQTVLKLVSKDSDAEVISVSGSNIVFESFTITDITGGGIGVKNTMGITFRDIKFSCMFDNHTLNGNYGVWISKSSNILMDNCEIYGGTIAGFYVQESKNIVLKGAQIWGNSAGIKLENSTDCDIADNTFGNNVSGIFILKNPDLSTLNSSRYRIFNNKINDNNFENFAKAGSIEAKIPTGSGIILIATNQCQVFNNEMIDNNGFGVAILSYDKLQKPFNNALFNPNCAAIEVFDNNIKNGDGVMDKSTELGQFLVAAVGDKLPEIVYDGSLNTKSFDSYGNLKEAQRICIRNNGEHAQFVNLELAKSGSKSSRDMRTMDCVLTPLNEVKIISN